MLKTKTSSSHYPFTRDPGDEQAHQMATGICQPQNSDLVPSVQISGASVALGFNHLWTENTWRAKLHRIGCVRTFLLSSFPKQHRLLLSAQHLHHVGYYVQPCPEMI